MASKQILVLGASLSNCDCIDFTSQRSLLDGDIVIVFPLMRLPDQIQAVHEGKSFFHREDMLPRLRHIQHWKSELASAFKAGRSIVIFMVPLTAFYYYTEGGEHELTGTNYDMLPFKFERIRNTNGTRVAVGPQGIEPLKEFVNLLEHLIEYNTVFSFDKKEQWRVALTTPDGSMATAGHLAGSNGGHIVLVPNLKQLATHSQIIAACVAIDRACRAATERSTPPGWLTSGICKLSSDDEDQKKIADLNKQFYELTAVREKAIADAVEHAKIKDLLFERGPALEQAVRIALIEMGFEAKHFHDGNSRFDAVFTLGDARFLAEIEGKDAKAVNVDTFSQLEKHIGEDFAREEVSEPAIGVLFGNAYRELPPGNRGEFFTEKVLRSAKRTGVRLIRTPDLFLVLKHFRETGDRAFLEACRRAMVDQTGRIVEFPLPRELTPAKN